ncbi:MAG: hypothetical protein LUH05_06780, partial [Candidatus Gastranaerophilales bacterium]|nr:hypothetical protein [Candidatus Gastranaerophilales bacterium]
LIVEMFFRFRYLHIDDVFRYDLNSLPRFYHSFCHSLKNLITVFSQTLNYDFGSVMLLLSLIALFLIICFYSIKNKNIKIFIYGILLMIIPFSAFLLTGNFEWYYRVYTSFCITEGVTFILLYNLCKNNTKLLNIFFVFVSLIVLYQTKEFNQIFYTENLKFNNDVKFANSIKYDLERLNLDEKPVVFAGIRKDLPLKHHYYNESPEINVSTFNWDRYNNFDAEIFVKRPYAFMHELGIPVRGWWEIDDERFKEPDVFFNLVKANTKEMNIYPGKNSIRDFGSFVLIKIGRSEAEREEETERKE